MPEVKPVQHFLIRINRPRPAYLMGPKELISQAARLETLERGKPGYLTYPGVGELKTYDIQVGTERIFEVEEASALMMIEQLGLELGEEGLPMQVTEGS